MLKIDKTLYQDLRHLPFYKDYLDPYRWALPRLGGACESVLDYGCGVGHLLSLMKEEDCLPDEYYGADLDPENLSKCRSILGGRHTHWILPPEYPRETYSCVVSIGVLCFSYDFMATITDLRQKTSEKLIFDYIRDDLWANANQGTVSFNREEIYLVFSKAKHIEFEHLVGSVCDMVFVEF